MYVKLYWRCRKIHGQPCYKKNFSCYTSDFIQKCSENTLASSMLLLLNGGFYFFFIVDTFSHHSKAFAAFNGQSLTEFIVIWLYKINRIELNFELPIYRYKSCNSKKSIYSRQRIAMKNGIRRNPLSIHKMSNYLITFVKLSGFSDVVKKLTTD